MVTNADWRLMGQDTWLARRELRWAEWSSPRPGWDHDHCAFCQAEFGTRVSDRTQLRAGYVTADDRDVWICSTCFDDFKASFDWTVTTDPPQQ